MVVVATVGGWYSTNEPLVQQTLIYALLAFSIQVALRSGVFSLAGVGFYAIGSYTAGILVKHDWNPALAIIVAVALAAVIGWGLATLLRRLRDLYLGIATVAFDLMVGVVAVNWTSVTGGPIGLIGIPTSVTTVEVLITFLVVATLLVLMERGILGRTLIALREDEELARSVSINISRYRTFAFVLSSALGALAGAFYALIFVSVQATDASFSLLVLALAMVVIGGYNSWVGAFIGAIALTWIPFKLISIGEWWAVVYGGLMIAMGTFARTGFLGIAGSAAHWGRRRVQHGRVGSCD